MFRNMRRFKQQLPQEEAEQILLSASSGVLALLGDDGYPYAVPLSYVYQDGRLYFHSAVEGHKIDAIRSCDRASFCVVAADDVIPARLTTQFRSVIAFGRVRLVEDEEEKLAAIRLIARRYAPGMTQQGEEEIRGSWNRMHLIALEIEHMTGKEARELMESRGRA